jgi:hypothetical protein
VIRDEFTTGVPQGTSAVNVVPFAGEILALGEQGSPPVRLEFLLFDTADITAGPITRIELPFQIGWTPHGHWMDFS